MEGLFTASNTHFLIIPFILIGTTILSASYVIWHKKDKINKILLRSLIVFLIIYLPLLDYWSFWKVSFFWPDDFFHESDSILSSPENIQFGYYPTTQIIFTTLAMGANFIFWFSSILFIKQVGLKQKNRFLFLNWIPLVNSFAVGFQLKKLMSPKLSNILLINSWVLFSFLFVFYRFFSGWMFMLGFDSISFVGDLIFPDTSAPETPNEYDNGYTYITDLISVITPPFFYISGILIFFIVKSIKNNPNESLDIEISKIGQS